MYVFSLSYLDFELDLISEVISRLVLDVLIYFSLPLVYIHIASIFIYIFGNYILLLYYDVLIVWVMKCIVYLFWGKRLGLCGCGW